jgi:hypothetical protein
VVLEDDGTHPPLLGQLHDLEGVPLPVVGVGAVVRMQIDGSGQHRIGQLLIDRRLRMPGLVRFPVRLGRGLRQNRRPPIVDGHGPRRDGGAPRANQDLPGLRHRHVGRSPGMVSRIGPDLCGRDAHRAMDGGAERRLCHVSGTGALAPKCVSAVRQKSNCAPNFM